MGKSLTEIVGTSVVVGAAGAGLIFVVSAAGAAMGAVSGQILDWVPYLNHAIPEGIAYVGHAFGNTDVTQVTHYLEGNLDKVGAAMGFLGAYVKSTVTHESK